MPFRKSLFQFEEMHCVKNNKKNDTRRTENNHVIRPKHLRWKKKLEGESLKAEL